MCGICGIVNNRDKVSTDIVKLMTKKLTHRGPDDVGFFFDDNIGLGFRRLIIIDAETGRQPMSNEDGSIWVVFNGEIYNFKELRTDLKKKGHIFKTLSDTEVIVHGYENWGIDLISKIKGMYGIALWDGINQQLVLARDRIGIKPLYYAATTDSLYFASEIKSLLINKKEIDTQIDLDALNLYLTFNYIPAPFTIFRGIRALLPAHLLICKDGKVETREYWDVPKNDQSTESINEKTFTNALKTQLEKSIRDHMISDVPVGAFLSGGLDSSAIVAYMSSIKNEPIKTFSIDFEDKSYSELNYAKIVAKYFKTEHHWAIVKPDIQTILPKIIGQFDEPFADSSAIPLYFLSQLASEYVKVVLTGDGGDEIFAGYPTYLANSFINYYHKIPESIKNVLQKIVANLPVSYKKYSFDFKAKRFIEGTRYDVESAHLFWRMIFTDTTMHMLLNNNVKYECSDKIIESFFSSYFKRARKFNDLNKFCYFDIKAYLPNDMLVKVDRMTMAHSLEARVPLLDSDLVELAFRIPGNLKVKCFTAKYILKKTLKDILPKIILKRRKKGFNVPMPIWINNDLKDMFWDVLLQKKGMFNEFINLKYVENMLNDHYCLEKDYSHQLYGLLVLRLWQDNTI